MAAESSPGSIERSRAADNRVRRPHRLATVAVGVVALLLAMTSIRTTPAFAAGRCASSTGGVEQRIASFWQCVGALGPGDMLLAADLGQWAQNVIQRDPGACIRVSDFTTSTASLQSALDKASVGVPPSPPNSADVENRIAAFWQRVNALGSSDSLAATDVGQWALNVIDRDPSRRIRVDDFQASTIAMQGFFDAAKAAGAACKPSATPSPSPSASPSATPSQSPTSSPSATPTPTPAPTPSPTPYLPYVPPTYPLATYTDGWQVSLTGFQEQPPLSQYSQPDTGMRFVVVFVRFDNRSAAAQDFNPFDFVLQDSVGVRRNRTFTLSGRNDALVSGQLAPGGFVTGSIIFQAPMGDQALRLIYDRGYSNGQFTWNLYGNPTPYPVPTSAYQYVWYTNLWQVWPLASQDLVATSPYAVQPAAGTRFVIVTVRFDNRTSTTQSFNLYDFQIQDSSGVRHDPTFYFSRNDSLGSGYVAPGAFVSGTIVFQVPLSDRGLTLIYQSYGYGQTSWALH